MGRTAPARARWSALAGADNRGRVVAGQRVVSQRHSFCARSGRNHLRADSGTGYGYPSLRSPQIRRMTTFALHSGLDKDTAFVADWPLCRALLMNDARYPWLILVPRRAGAV